jgi:hypothetical protein
MHYSLRTEEAYVHWVRGFIHDTGIAPRPPFRAREPAFPCYDLCRPTPSFTAAATSAS